MKLLFIIFFQSIIIFSFIGCTEQRISISNDRVLRIYNWEDYIGSDTIHNFEIETGIKVIMSNYEDEEEMFATIRSNLSSYDLVISSDDLIREMILTKTLLPLDKSKLKKISNIDYKYLNLEFDPGNIYSVPYLWGTTGILINTDFIDEDRNSWKLLFNEKYRNKIAMINNSFEVFAGASKSMDYSINYSNINEIDLAYNLLLKNKINNIGFFDVYTIIEMLKDKKIWAGQVYSGEALATVSENENLEYVIPKEGSPIWLDSFVILKDSPNADEAHIFIDYILNPKIIAKISTELWYASPNIKANKFIDSKVLNSPSVYPSKDILNNCEYYNDIGPLTPYLVKKWSMLK